MATGQHTNENNRCPADYSDSYRLLHGSDQRPPSAKRDEIANAQLSPVSRPRVWLQLEGANIDIADR